MASWLTHLRIAERIKQKVSDIDFPYFIIGSIAPGSDVPYERKMCHLSEEIIHCRCQDSNAAAYTNEFVFYDSYLMPEKILTRSDSTRSFLWGYYFHLITDRLWQEEYISPFRTLYENEFNNPNKDFSDLIKEEIFSLDFEYLKEKGPELIEQIRSFDGSINLFYEFDSEYIYEYKNQIADFYSGEPLNLDREYKYLSPQIIEEFIAKASEKCIKKLVI